VTALCLSLGLLALVWSTACRRHSLVTAPVTPPVIAAPAGHVTPARDAHPRRPAYRLDNGLGSPIA
jgi:hypothetical protein